MSRHLDFCASEKLTTRRVNTARVSKSSAAPARRERSSGTLAARRGSGILYFLTTPAESPVLPPPPPHSGPPPEVLAPGEMAARAPVVDVLGHRMAVHHPSRDRFITPSLVHAGCFEPFLTELVANELRPGDTVLDLGAHIGYYTLLFARLVGPGGRVVALEPDPDNFALLERNVALNGYRNISAYNLAAAEGPGRRALYKSADNAGDHRLHAAEAGRSAVPVDAVAVDDLFRDRGNIGFVKMDVQGSEGSALEGMAGLLARSPRVKMMLEFWPFGLARAGYGALRLLDRLRALGFRVYEADEADGSVRKTDPRRLLERYPETRDVFTNLWCVKGSIGPAPTSPQTGCAS